MNLLALAFIALVFVAGVVVGLAWSAHRQTRRDLQILRELDEHARPYWPSVD